MKVVGLLSGGKDSCFNLCHCVANGHEIVALASLQPGGGKEEIDSYMYQTVGQDVIHYIAEAMDLPLFRRTIEGTAVDQSSDYASTSAARSKGHVDGDETEDLYLLLKQVLAAHPDIEGVSAGAILSNYQRIRVEHVCARLGLQSLSYLWQYDQSQLLEDMDRTGLHSIIIKVAGAGLGTKHLGRNVCSPEMRLELENLRDKWGTHPAGEGGEYETFTLDSPLFRKRIELLETQPVVLSQGSHRDEMGTVAYLRLLSARLVEKSAQAIKLRDLPIPSSMDASTSRLAESLAAMEQPLTDPAASAWQADRAALRESDTANIEDRDDWVTMCNTSHIEADSPEEQMKGCFERVRDQLAKCKLDLTAIAHVNLYVSSMSLFAPLNAVYNTYFGPSPPTRACVGAILPEGCYVKMDIMAYRPNAKGKQRTALHVRGLSYWAPANIGPYSQAVIDHDRLFIAGQIGLNPANLTLPSSPPSFAMEAALSLQHVRRIMTAVTSSSEDWHIESCICWLSGPASSFSAKRDMARRAWIGWNAELDDTSDAIITTSRAPLLLVQTTELPKGAQVEWQITLKRSPPFGDDGTSDDEAQPQIRAERIEPKLRKMRIDVGSIPLACRILGTAREHFALLSELDEADPTNSRETTSAATTQEVFDGTRHGRLFYTGHAAQMALNGITAALWNSRAPHTPLRVINMATEFQDHVHVALLAFCGEP